MRRVCRSLEPEGGRVGWLGVSITLQHAFGFSLFCISLPRPHTVTTSRHTDAHTMGNNKNDKDTSQPKARDKYPAPKVYEAPEDIKKTLPTEEDLDDLVPLFTWGELKEIIRGSGARVR